MFKLELRDETRRLIDKVTENWLLHITEINPSLLTAFRDKNLKPARNLLPWSGEFPGKVLTGAAMFYTITGSETIRDYFDGFITKLISYQESNGYLGVFDEEHQLTGDTVFYKDYFRNRESETVFTWDLWNHYHLMYGLLEWGRILGRQDIYDCVQRIADLLMKTFYGPDGKRMIDLGSPEMNLAPYHVFAILYNRTGKKKYLDFARKIEEDTEDERAGNYMKYARENREYYQCPKPRWESMHIIMGYAEMYRATGEEKYRDALRQIVYSILKTDVHNTGGFSTDEQAIGTPYKNSNIETCCSIAFNAVVTELIRLEPDVKLADFLENSTYNAIMGSYSKSGFWSTYDTPMDGFKRANFDSIGFQNRPGSPMLNCCSANAPRGLGEVCRWGAVDAGDESYIHYFGRGKYSTEKVAYSIEGNYPYQNRVMLKVFSDGIVNLRIPAWSEKTECKLNGVPQTVKPGTYFRWNSSKGDVIDLTLDFSLRTESGKEDYEGKISVWYGPILLGADNGQNPTLDFDNLPVISPKMLEEAQCRISDAMEVEVYLENGLKLTDFFSLGQDGTAYRTWLNAV